MHTSDLTVSESGSQPICIVMAVYRPNRVYLREQLISLAGQDHPFWLCAVIADGESADLLTDFCGEMGIECLTVMPEVVPLDSANAFQAGLAAALDWMPQAELFAFCDQDDVWHSERLSASAAHLAETGAALVHSDARTVDAEGKVLRASLHQSENRDLSSNLRQLVMRNNVTGMSALFTRHVAELASPFPFARRVYHDNWLAVIAHSQPGGVVPLDRALVDYRQHGANLVGAGGMSGKPGLQPFSRNWFIKGRLRYYRMCFLAAHLVRRLHERQALSASTFHQLKPFVAPGFSWLVFWTDWLRFSRYGITTSADLAMQCFAASAYRVVKGTLQGRLLQRTEAIRSEDVRQYADVARVNPAEIETLLDEVHRIQCGSRS